MILIIEGIVMCFVLLLICVIGIANGPIGLVVFYEQEVKDRVVELGLTTEEKIRKTSIITVIALFVPMLVLVPLMVYGINGVTGFWDGFRQMLTIFMISGLFDRLFIDWWWVGHTKAWIIPGTEEMRRWLRDKLLGIREESFLQQIIPDHAYGKQFFKIAKLALRPFGAYVVRV